MLYAQPSSVDQVADWLETLAIICEERAIPLQRARDQASEFANVSAAQANLAFSTMARRSECIGDAYPFIVDDLAVRTKDNHLAYAYTNLLFLSRTSTGTPWFAGNLPIQDTDHFEALTSLAMTGLLGQGSKAISFGWPSKINRPEHFPDAVIWLANLMGVPVGSGYRPPRRKDGGVDVVAWRPFKDKKSGFPIYLVQCTVQQDFIYKSRDIDLRLWSGWLIMDRDPVTVLAIPRTVQPGAIWDEVTANSVILERLRLCELVRPIISEEFIKFSRRKMTTIYEYIAQF